MDKQPTAVSLFSSGGIGDLALRASGFRILLSNELLEDRHSLFERNFPGVVAITGDIWRKQRGITEAAAHLLGGRELDLFFATPPCQGMSKNGRGKLLSAIRAGRKPPFDGRNRLIIPTLRVAKELRPRIIIFENVPEMAETFIVDEGGEVVRILDYIRRELGPEYVGGAEVVEFADYGVPQCRQRLITTFSRDPTLSKWYDTVGTFLPKRTHSAKGGNGTKRWVSLRDAIGSFPPLDAGDPARARSEIPFHRVPLLEPMKYWWVRNTPPEKGAFDNQCVECGFDGNAAHGARKGDDGINRASIGTPLHCARCGALLPRPSVERGGKREIMRGFTSAYKRMAYGAPASALTRNLSYACSDNKLHPEQHRVLSIAEALRIHTVDAFSYDWTRRDGTRACDKLVREVIGESIPPKGLQVIFDHILRVFAGRVAPSEGLEFGPLFKARKEESTPLCSVG